MRIDRIQPFIPQRFIRLINHIAVFIKNNPGKTGGGKLHGSPGVDAFAGNIFVCCSNQVPIGQRI